MAVRVICINKAGGDHENQHVAISILGWINEADRKTGRSTRLEMHDFLTKGGVAYVTDDYGNRAYLRPRISRLGNPYVQTEADGTPTDNLLWLPEC